MNEDEFEKDYMNTFGEHPSFSKHEWGKPKSAKNLGKYAWETPKTLSKLSKSDEFAMNLAEVIDELEDIVNCKQQDYGSNAILGSPYGALNGILVRMHDKMNRVVHLEKSKQSVKNESLRDTFIDIAGYALLAVLVIDDKFPKD